LLLKYASKECRCNKYTVATAIENNKNAQLYVCKGEGSESFLKDVLKNFQKIYKLIKFRPSKFTLKNRRTTRRVTKMIKKYLTELKPL